VDETSRRILIIDDEKMIRDVVVRIMDMKGHTAVESESGDDAIELLKEDHDFDYAILDLSMPGEISGPQTFDLLLENYPDIKVIISTGYIDQDDSKAYTERGAYAILEKPYKIDDILSLIQ